jgi:hypothetical protein
MVNIDTNDILMALVTKVVVCCQARILILLLEAILIFIPALRKPSGFDFLVLLTGIALLGVRVESCVNNLATTCLETLVGHVCLNHLKEFIHNSSLAQSHPEGADCGGIWNAVHHAKPDKLLKEAFVIHLEFKLFVAEVEKLLENEHL